MTIEKAARHGRWPALAAGRRALGGDLPARYHEYLDGEVRARFLALVVPGAQVLDVGSGKRPILLPGDRPKDAHYVGLDISEHELALAPEGGYDESRVADAAVRVPDLAGRFDLVLSRWLLEHVRPIDVVLENFRAYLRPGGMLVAYLAGGRSLGAVASRLLGHRLGSALLTRLTYRTPATVFPAEYDRCSYAALVAMGERWKSWEVMPLYENARYLNFSRPLQSAYVVYEEMIVQRDLRALATHYILFGEA